MKRRRKLNIEEYGGFILGFEPERTETIEEYIASGYPVSESFSSRDWNLQDREFAFLASQGEQINLFAAVILKKTGAGGGHQARQPPLHRCAAYRSSNFGSRGGSARSA